MCVNQSNTRPEDVELVETLASTMTESTQLGNLLIAISAFIRNGGTLCLALEQPRVEGPPAQRPPGIYPPN